MIIPRIPQPRACRRDVLHRLYHRTVRVLADRRGKGASQRRHQFRHEEGVSVLVRSAAQPARHDVRNELILIELPFAIEERTFAPALRNVPLERTHLSLCVPNHEHLARVPGLAQSPHNLPHADNCAYLRYFDVFRGGAVLGHSERAQDEFAVLFEELLDVSDVSRDGALVDAVVCGDLRLGLTFEFVGIPVFERDAAQADLGPSPRFDHLPEVLCGEGGKGARGRPVEIVDMPGASGTVFSPDLRFPVMTSFGAYARLRFGSKSDKILLFQS